MVGCTGCVVRVRMTVVGEKMCGVRMQGALTRMPRLGGFLGRVFH